MVKQVKDQLEYTDNFITERTEGGYPKQFLTSGYDLRDFIEDSQSRFTDEIESIVDDLSIKVEQNRKDIRDNEIANKDDHNRYDSESTKQKRETLDNRSELNKIRTRTKKLIQDDRVLGYYLNASEELTVNVNPDTEEESFLPPAGQVPPGTFALMDGNFELNDGDVSDTEFIVFNTTDLLDNTRSFLGIFSGDIIELSFIKRTEKPNAIDGFDKEYLGRVTFRTKLEYDSASQIGNSIIKVDVAFVNSSFTTDVPKYEELPDTIRLTEYVSVSVMPALVVDDLVDPNTLRNAVLPIGSIIPWASNNIPNGWLICDGRKIDSVAEMTDDQKTNLRNILKTDILPPLAGRYVAGVKGNHSNTGVHSFNTLGSLYRKQTGPPTISLASGGEHSHSASTSNAGSHHHSVGSNNSMSGNSPAVYDVRTTNQGSYETSEAGDHNHNANVASYNVSHNHEVSGFNNDTRPNTVALNYIIKYK